MLFLNIATWNINGLAPNVNEVEVLLDTHKLDILLISETHLTDRSSVNIKNYTTHNTKHPDGTAHGGTAVIIRSSIKHHELAQYGTEHIQATTIAVEGKTGNFNVSAVYCPPKHKIKEEQWTHYFSTLGPRFMAGGDWNAKHPHWGSRLTSTRGRQLKLSIENNNLTTLSTAEPTHWPTDISKLPDTIDFFICKGMTQYFTSTTSCLDGSSNHTPVLLTISTILLEYEPTPKMYNKDTDWDSFGDIINRTLNLQIALKTPEDIDTAATQFTNLIQVASWLTTPDKPANKLRHNSVPWEIRKKIQEKRRLRRVWHCSRHHEDKKAYNKAMTELKEVLRNAKNETTVQRLEALTANKSTNYSLWKATSDLNQPKRTRPPLKLEGGKWARTPQQRIDTFANHLSTVFQPNEGIHSEDSDIDETLNQDFQLDVPIKHTTPREVFRTLSRLDNNKAPGFDQITKEVLIRLPKKGIVFLTTLFNGIMRVGHYPSIWKISQIIMIFKEGKPTNEVSSYRPISLLPVISKVFEKILLSRMVKILQQRTIIPDHQFGFRREHSTIEQVHRVIDQIRKTLENGEYCSAAFLDVQQAFDKVWHKGLLSKIKTLLPHPFFGLLKSYTSERIFQVKDGEYTTKLHDIKAGVPQGSVLGPVLYTIYTCDLPETPDVVIATFADDTAILASSKDRNQASQNLQRGLDKIEEWLKKWRIKASASKSTQITFALRVGDCPPVHLGDTTLPHNESVKYLGMHLDRRLTWKKHLQMKREQLNRTYRGLQWLLGRNSVLSTDNKLLIYKVVLKPIWTYGIQLWGSACNSNIAIIQRAQNGILRNLSNAPWFLRNCELHEELNFKTVSDEIRQNSMNYKQRLATHPNPLATELLTINHPKRLKRNHIVELDLK